MDSLNGMNTNQPTTFSPITAAYRLPEAVYPSTPPYHPSEGYPEYQWGVLGEQNLVYEGVRQLFYNLGLDEEHFGSPGWNPLGQIIQPGDRVVLKPNLLTESHKFRLGEWEQVITHGSVIRAVLDYVLIALNGSGEVSIIDGPTLEADWDAIIDHLGLNEIVNFSQSVSRVPIRLVDLRDVQWEFHDDVIFDRIPRPGDPEGGVVVNVDRHSRLVGYKGEGRYYGADYDQVETNGHHQHDQQEYRISGTACWADVIINLPKMKTHKKVGVTLCLKNLVGINVGRNWLPHHSDGDPTTGGDQFPASSAKNNAERWGVRSLQRLSLRAPGLFSPVYRQMKKMATPVWGTTETTIRSGNWYGNDTAWRMVHDINRALLYTQGIHFPSSSPKRYLAIVDGVIAGDGNGPTAPDRYEAGCLVAGFNPVAVDCVAARLMGFDPLKIAMLREAYSPSALPLAPFSYQDITIVGNRPEWQGFLAEIDPDSCFHFNPHFGWVGQIEWDRR